MSDRWNNPPRGRGPGGNQPSQPRGFSGPGFGQGYPFYGGGFGPNSNYWTSGQGGYAFGGFYGSGGFGHGRYGQGRARLGANQGQGFGSSYLEGIYGGGSGLGYGGFGPYGHPYQGQNFGLGYGYGSYGAPTSAGPHVGKGPRNYQRSDEELQDAICHRLTQDGFDTNRIAVAVHHGQVTLSGSVASRPWKRRAEDVAESVGGVVDVHNRLSISATH